MRRITTLIFENTLVRAVYRTVCIESEHAKSGTFKRVENIEK